MWQNEHYQLIAEGINGGIWDWATSNGKEWWSDKFYTLLGYIPDEIETSYNNFLNKLLHPDDRQKVLDAVNCHLANKTSYLLDIRMRHKDGICHWYETCGKAKFNRRGKPERMVGSVIEKNERKKLELELKRDHSLMDEMAKIGA